MVRRGDGGQGCGAHWVCFRRTLPGWWNGRHGALKMLCPKGRAGSSPALGTKAWSLTRGNAEQGPLSLYLVHPSSTSGVGSALRSDDKGHHGEDQRTATFLARPG